jgi:hypothetical protein
MDSPQSLPSTRLNFGFRISDFGLRFGSASMQRSLRVLCVLCGYSFLSHIQVSAASQELVIVSGEVVTASLIKITDNQAAFVWKGQGPSRQGLISDELSLTDIVRWGNPVAARAQTIVVLVDGGQLVTAPDWAGGAAVRLDGDVVVVMSETLGEVRLPRQVVSGVVFAQRRHAADRASLVEDMRSPPTASDDRRANSDDAVMLTNQDRLNGKLTKLERGSLTIEMALGDAKFPLSRVEAIEFGGGRQPTAVRSQAKMVIGLGDGSMVYADEVVASENELKLKIGEEIAFAGGSVSDVVFLQSLGERVVYLSELEAAEYRHVPYLEVGWPLARDRNVLSGPLLVGGTRYLKGLGMHSAGRASYRLDGKYQRFEAAVAIDDAADGRGSVTFAVYVLRDGKLSEAYKSGIVRGGDAPQRASVDVAGAQGITLVVDYAERGDEMDRADWLDARLIKED